MQFAKKTLYLLDIMNDNSARTIYFVLPIMIALANKVHGA